MSRRKDIKAISAIHAKVRGIAKTEAERELELFSARELRATREVIWNSDDPWMRPSFSEVVSTLEGAAAIVPAIWLKPHPTVQ